MVVAGLVVVLVVVAGVGQLAQPVRWVYFPPLNYEYEGEEYTIPGWWFEIREMEILPSTDPIADEAVWRVQMHPFGH